MIKILNKSGFKHTSHFCMKADTVGTIVGWNIKKTMIAMGDINHEVYGLFVHIKTADAQYTLIFDAFPVATLDGMHHSVVDCCDRIETKVECDWDSVKRVMKRVKIAKRIRKSFKKSNNKHHFGRYHTSHKNMRYYVDTTYEPTILRLFNLCGASESVDIIGKEVRIATVEENMEFLQKSEGNFLYTYIRDGEAIMDPLMWYVDTDNKSVNDYIDLYIKKHPYMSMPLYGHEAQE